MSKKSDVKRRTFIKSLAMSTAGIAAAPYISCGRQKVPALMTRQFGRLNFATTTMGLGGQASIQWTPQDVDPVQIILKAFNKGINYYDTSNLYGPSQTNYGKAFQQLKLIPGKSDYDEKLRRSIFLTSKTRLRMGKGTKERENVGNRTNGDGTSAVDDLKRTLSQVFGDGKGNYPQGAYLDMILLHSISHIEEVDAVYLGLDNPDPNAEEIGALAALLDYRDGTNTTGLNPKEEKLVHHLGFSGHYSPPVMMELIQRDSKNILDGMLVAINANDQLNFNMQHNVIPVAQAKNMGVIGMKTFADGAMYSKGAHFSGEPKHVVRTVGDEKLSSDLLIQYSLTTPGVNNLIIGIGQISDEPKKCQLVQNLAAAQIEPDGLTARERREIEEKARWIKNGKTNYFQRESVPMSAPRDIEINQKKQDDQRAVELTWHTAFAGNAPLKRYEVWRDEKKVGQVEHQPQTTKEPFSFVDHVEDRQSHQYTVVSVDAEGRRAESNEMVVRALV